MGEGACSTNFGHHKSTTLAVETGGFDVCQIRSVDQIRLKAWQALPVEESGDRKVCRVCLKSQCLVKDKKVKYESL